MRKAAPDAVNELKCWTAQMPFPPRAGNGWFLQRPRGYFVLEAYRKHVEERAAQGVPPLPLDPQQVAELIELIKNPPKGEGEFLLDLLTNRVPPGVDQAAYVKAGFLADVAKGKVKVDLIDRKQATFLLGTMLGGYNISSLIELLDDADTAPEAVTALSNILLIYDAFHDVKKKADAGFACLAPGECGPGLVECAGAAGTRCSTAPGGSNDKSVAEIPDNAKDDDCDGEVDEP